MSEAAILPPPATIADLDALPAGVREDGLLPVCDDIRGIDAPLPDILLRCGPVVGGRSFVTTPLIVAEILPHSTMDHDRGPTLRVCQSQPATLRHIVMIDQSEVRVECCDRAEHGWDMRSLTRPEDTLSLPALMSGKSMARRFARVDVARP